LLNETAISLNFFAYKMAKTVSSPCLRWFYTNSSADYIKYSNNHQFESEKASHYILNFQYSKKRKTFRAETYYKDYRNLVKFDTEFYLIRFMTIQVLICKGLICFERWKIYHQNLEYWVSYSYIDTERDYKILVLKSHQVLLQITVSIVTKYWINDWKSQIGLQIPTVLVVHNNPNETKFMNGKQNPTIV
jgi:hypothetical protein